MSVKYAVLIAIFLIFLSSLQLKTQSVSADRGQIVAARTKYILPKQWTYDVQTLVLMLNHVHY